MIIIGILICLGTHFAARRGARRWLRIPGVGTLSREGDPSYFETPRGRRLAWRLAGPSTAYALSTLLVLLMLLASGEQQSGTATTNAEGRLGLSPVLEFGPKPLGEALAEAVALPIVGAVRAAMPLWNDLVAAPRTDLAGPVGIVRAIGAEPARPLARTRFLLTLLAYPTAFVWPISPFVELLLTPRRRRAG